MTDRPTIKIMLTNRGEDVETPWAVDLGPARGPAGSRRVRLLNVPYLYAKPTWGDVIIVSPDDRQDGWLTWDQDGVAWSKIGTRIARDGGRHVMIVDYRPRRPDDSDGAVAYRALRAAAGETKVLARSPVVCEGLFGPRGRTAGRDYLAVKAGLRPAQIMTRLRAPDLPFTATLIHPAPRARARARRR